MSESFCPRCGTAQEFSNLFCPKCGMELPRGAETEENRTGNEGQSGILDPELWERLRAEERAASLESRKRLRVGCLVLVALLLAFGILVWFWGAAAP